MIIEKESLPKEFIVNAWTNTKTIMGIQHENFPLVGLQFHPESISSEEGMKILNNYLQI